MSPISIEPKLKQLILFTAVSSIVNFGTVFLIPFFLILISFVIGYLSVSLAEYFKRKPKEQFFTIIVIHSIIIGITMIALTLYCSIGSHITACDRKFVSGVLPLYLAIIIWTLNRVSDYIFKHRKEEKPRKIWKLDLLSRLGPKIIVNVDLDTFVFEMDDHSIRLDTCLSIQQGEIVKVNIVDIGDDNYSGDKITKVELFIETELPEGYTRDVFLQIFLQHGIWSLMSRQPSIIKPVVSFRNIECLDQVLYGYQKVLLEYLGTQAGARKITFE